MHKFDDIRRKAYKDLRERFPLQFMLEMLKLKTIRVPTKLILKSVVVYVSELRQGVALATY